MGILVVDESAVDREAVAGLLQKGRYRVDRAADLKAARAHVERELPQVVVLVWPREGGVDFIKFLRARESGQDRAHVLALLDKSQSDVRALFAAGVDDFAWRPCSPDELLARVDAPRRIGKWAGRTCGDEWRAYSDIRRLRSCQQLGAIVAADLAQVVGQPLEISSGSLSTARPLRGATIRMTLASEQTDLCISVLVEPSSLSALGAQLLGDAQAPESATDDILRELANAAGGAVKRMGLVEGITLTTGLPENVHAPALESDRARFWVAAMKESGVRIAIVGEIQSHANKKIAASELREGMVVARDLCNEGGILLVAAGTRLTATTADRITRFLGKRVVVEVVASA